MKKRPKNHIEINGKPIKKHARKNDVKNIEKGAKMVPKRCQKGTKNREKSITNRSQNRCGKKWIFERPVRSGTEHSVVQGDYNHVERSTSFVGSIQYRKKTN